MPSIIVELGFHTNPFDALALQSRSFRKAAVNGIAKGWRMHSQGVGCEPLKITSIPQVNATLDKTADWLVNFEGHPKFPVTVMAVTKRCQAGWTCGNLDKQVAEPTESQLRVTWMCTGSESSTPATFDMESYIVDADGVKSAPVAHTFSCTASTSKGTAQEGQRVAGPHLEADMVMSSLSPSVHSASP
jgi:hypothetical protein